MSTTFFLKAKYKSPYLYFIKFKGYLYIGETQSHPTIRWSSHLQQNGSFRGKLNELGEILDSMEEIEFYCIALSPYMDDINMDAKIMSQAVEHSVHVEIRCNFLSFTGLQVISDTEKTAPNSKFKFRREADAIAEILSKLYQAHLLKTH